jgi:hypothetical protein
VNIAFLWWPGGHSDDHPIEHFRGAAHHILCPNVMASKVPG